MRKFRFIAIVATMTAGLIPWTAVRSQPVSDNVLLHSLARRPVVVDLRQFGTWTVRCTKGTPATLLPGAHVTSADEQKLRDCRTAALLTMNKSPLLPVRLIFSIIEKRTMIRILAFTPPRFALTNLNGPTLKIGTKTVPLRSMLKCVPISCASSGDVPISELANIENAKSITLVMPDLPGTKAAEFDIPAPGLGPSLEMVRKMAPQT